MMYFSAFRKLVWFGEMHAIRSLTVEILSSDTSKTSVQTYIESMLIITQKIWFLKQKLRLLRKSERTLKKC